MPPVRRMSGNGPSADDGPVASPEHDTRISNSRCWRSSSANSRNTCFFGVLKTLSILLEEAVRATFATDANQERLLIVHAARQSIGALGKQSVRGPFEKQKRRSRFELRVTLKQFAVSCLELAECSFSSLARSSNTFRPRASRVSRAARL